MTPSGTTVVVDASVLATALADDGPDGRAMRARLTDAGSLVAPDLVDVETTSALRRQWLAGGLELKRFRAAVSDLVALDMVRLPARPLLERVVELRNTVSAYDAVYVALAELLDATLLTADRRLAAAAGVRCHVEVLGTTSP
jgi:predicted nucleic acid-binding protein